ncbi:heavy metal translocating P-type ATPase [Mycoplasma sp. P36-A1]|uniref:heavy metal translocating P-type ATPase n=1 Tax=Mycoplasma sp. P36-A1 TaxID=3252900 RepID=UPI003C2C6085
MKYVIKHDVKNRMRVQVLNQQLSINDADALVFHLEQNNQIESIKVNEQTGSIVLKYQSDKTYIKNLLACLDISSLKLPAEIIDSSSRELNTQYKEKLITKVALRGFMKYIFPSVFIFTPGLMIIPLTFLNIMTALRSIDFIKAGIAVARKGKLEVPILDATAITMAIIRKDIPTASSIMFMLDIGELLEEWTHKKSVGDLARSLTLNVGKVWQVKDENLILVEPSDIKAKDIVNVTAGNVIPFDGIVVSGEATINQTSLTGESEPVFKRLDSIVYAGTVLEEGELRLEVREGKGQSRFERISKMIEDNEKLKSVEESKAEHMADRLVPVTFLATGLVYLVTRNITKALAVLMVDYSCALKLAMPVTVLEAMSEASKHGIRVKGGIYLENMAEATTIVFDKTGTITKAIPNVVDVISFNEKSSDEMLRISACLEEHFPHSMAKAVVKAAERKNLEHAEMHSKVDYVVAHGIRTTINGVNVIIGSKHFVFEDENTKIPKGKNKMFADLPTIYSHLYLAIDGYLAAVILIEDPIRAEAASTIKQLSELGFNKIVMMTGDSEHIAKNIAKQVGIKEFYAEVLPDDKATFVQKCVDNGEKVVMIGDGINDSPALSASSVGIAISDGAEIAREVSDITIAADDLEELVALRQLSVGMMQRVKKNYFEIIGFNTLLIALGVTGKIQPTTSALLHNTSTLLITVNGMKNIIPEPEHTHYFN